MVDVLTRIVIDAPRDIVSAFAADPTRAPEWYVNIGSVEGKTDGELRVGAKAAFVAHFLGCRLAYTYEVVEYRASEPGEPIERTSNS